MNQQAASIRVNHVSALTVRATVVVECLDHAPETEICPGGTKLAKKPAVCR